MSQDDTKILKEMKALDQKLADTNNRLEKLEGSLTKIAGLLTGQGDEKLARIETALAQKLHALSVDLFKIKSVSNSIVRALPKAGKKLIRVVFLVHNVETWDALHEIYQLMLAHERFDPIVITIRRDFLNTMNFGQEEINFEGLQQYGITPMRFADGDYSQQLEMLKLMDPDIIFRQSPWDASIPPAFHFHEINFAKMVYVSYGFGSVALGGGQANHYFMRSCWRAYCETEVHLQHWSNDISNGQLKASGSAKLDRILAGKDVGGWPLKEEPDSIRIIWAPHHSLTEDWLFFSTFMSNYQQFLQLAREAPNLQIVLKPHPTLLQKLVFLGKMTQEELLGYLNEFVSLPNASLVTSGDYIPLFWASDIMITDGIGFFAEYMVTGKPMIWTENPGHAPFNEIGQVLHEGIYRAGQFEDVISYLELLFVHKQDPLMQKRQDIIRQIAPHPGGVAKFIVNDILEGIDEE